MTASERSNADEPAQASGRAASAELGQLRRGEIGLDEYLNSRIEAAVEQLRGRVSLQNLETVRSVLREALRTDPGLTERLDQLMNGPSAGAHRD